MKKQLMLLALVFMVKFSFGGDNYFIKEDSTKVILGGKEISFDDTYLMYYDENNKSRKIMMKKVAYLQADAYRYINLPLYKNGGLRRLHRIVATNDEYILTSYFSNNQYFMYVFDKNYKMVEGFFAYYMLFSDRNRDAKTEKAMEEIKTYFPHCVKLLNILSTRVKSGDHNILEGIDNLNCD